MEKIIDFSNPEDRSLWTIVNDDVMGGRSTSLMRITDEGFANFAGILSLENNGGFASTRSSLLNRSLDGCDGLVIRVKGDGRSYRFRLRTSKDLDGVAYQREFQTTKGKWTELVLPFVEFVASYRGRLLPERGPVNPAEIRQVGILIADKKPGPFTLTIAWIASYRGTVTP
jgi:monofunctional biosynthetic peptidoglycan transglycosylase